MDEANVKEERNNMKKGKIGEVESQRKSSARRVHLRVTDFCFVL